MSAAQPTWNVPARRCDGTPRCPGGEDEDPGVCAGACLPDEDECCPEDCGCAASGCQLAPFGCHGDADRAANDDCCADACDACGSC